MKNTKSLYIISTLFIILSLITSSTGLFYSSGGSSYDFINQYGDTVKIYGSGLYAHDSYFKAPIFRGTDFTILCFLLPTLLGSLILDIKKKNLKTKLFLMSLLSVFTYYSASLAFGATYNILHLVYIVLFATSLFGLILAIGSIDMRMVSKIMGNALPYRGIYTFLVFTGVVLIAAWLPDIISSLAAGSSLALIEVYTTEITYVLDMGVIGPTAFLCLFHLIKRDGMGFILLEILLTLCITVGLMVPVQTVFQSLSGIRPDLPVLITKIGSFVLMALFALYFNIKFFKNVKLIEFGGTNGTNI